MGMSRNPILSIIDFVDVLQYYIKLTFERLAQYDYGSNHEQITKQVVWDRIGRML